MSALIDDNPLSSRGRLQYTPPGFPKSPPPITYNFNQKLPETHESNAPLDHALRYFRASGSYILILLLRSLHYGFSLLDKYSFNDVSDSHQRPEEPTKDFEIIEIPDTIPSSTPRGSLPVLGNVFTQSPKSDPFDSIFELDSTDDASDQYGTSLKASYGSKYVARGSTYNRYEEDEVSAADLLKSQLSTPRDEYDEMISRFYRPFKLAPQHYSLTNAMLVSKPSSDFSLLFKEARGAIQLLVSQERAAAESSIKPLSSEQLKLVNYNWGKQSNSLIVSAFSIDITTRDIQTLRDSNWLNDNVIDFYLNLVTENVKDTYCWTTHFFSTLKSKGYQGVARWAKRRRVNLAEKNKVIVPINIMGTHWAIAVVDNVTKSIGYYDSLSSGGNRKTVEILQDYMTKERERVGAPQIEYSLYAMMKTPQQQNGYDCGVFTCTVARYVAEETPLTFSQKDMKVIRRKMAYEIANKALLDGSRQTHL